MQPPEEQNLKPEEMDTETPLVVLGRAPWDRFELVVLLVISMCICIYLFVWFLRGHFRGDDFIFFLAYDFFIVVIGLLFFIYLIVTTIDVLFTSSFRLYKDRIEKCYGFFGKKIWNEALYLKDAYILMRDVSYGDRRGCKISVILKSGHVGSFLKKLTYHDRFRGEESLNADKFIDCCKSLGIEFLKTGYFVMQKEYFEAIENGSRKKEMDIIDIVAFRKE